MENQKFVYAGFWWRIRASTVDALLLYIWTPSLYILNDSYGGQGFDAEKMLAAIILSATNFFQSIIHPTIPAMLDFFLWWIFLPVGFFVTFFIYKATTPGKLTIFAKIVDANTGEKPSIITFILRHIYYIISALPLGLGFFWIIFDKKKQGWHDKLAGTIVIRKDNNGVDLQELLAGSKEKLQHNLIQQKHDNLAQKLYDEGSINKEEYQQKRTKILDSVI